jgi:hypothetical protein
MALTTATVGIELPTVAGGRGEGRIGVWTDPYGTGVGDG